MRYRVHRRSAVMSAMRALAVLSLALSARSARAQNKTRSFHVDLTSDEQPKVTVSPGSGRLDVNVDTETLKMNYRVVFQNLTSRVTGIHLHGPCWKGDLAPAILDLAPRGMATPLQGSMILTEGQLQYMLNGEIYLNIKTQRCPEGEIRGQFQRRPDRSMDDFGPS